MREWFKLNKKATELGTEIRAGVALGGHLFCTVIIVSVILSASWDFNSSSSNDSLSSSSSPISPKSIYQNNHGVTTRDDAFNSIFTVLCAISAISTLSIGLVSNLPIAFSPSPGIAIYLSMGLATLSNFSWSSVSVIVLVSVILFLLICFFRVLDRLSTLIPIAISIGTSMGIGVMLGFVAMQWMGILTFDSEGFISIADLTSYRPWLSVIGVIAICIIMYHQQPILIPLVVLIMAIIDWAITHTFPSSIVSLPHIHINHPIFDWKGAFTPISLLPACALLFLMVIDSTGIYNSLRQHTSRSDEIQEHHGGLKTVSPSNMVFFTTAISSGVSCVFTGAPVLIAVESVSAIVEGGKSGVPPVIASFFFILFMFFAPFIAAIPYIALSPLLILIGIQRISDGAHLHWNTANNVIPAILVMLIIGFTSCVHYAIVIGLFVHSALYFISPRIFVSSTPSTSRSAGSGKHEDGSISTPMGMQSGSGHIISSHSPAHPHALANGNHGGLFYHFRHSDDTLACPLSDSRAGEEQVVLLIPKEATEKSRQAGYGAVDT